MGPIRRRQGRRTCRLCCAAALGLLVAGCGAEGAADGSDWRNPAQPATAQLPMPPLGHAQQAVRPPAELEQSTAAPARPDSAEAEVVFGALADPQYCDCPHNGIRHFRRSASKLREAMAHFGQAQVDFTIQLGDLIDRDYESFPKILEDYRLEGAELYHVLGNHDWIVRQGDKPRVLATLGLEAGSYYSFGRGGWRFLVMDGTELGAGADLPDAPAEQPAAAMAPGAGGGVSAAQLEWLDHQLALATGAAERVIIFCHYPVFPPGWPHNLSNAVRVRAAIARHPGVVAAHLSGHNHAGGYGEQAGVHYVTLQAMVDTHQRNAYALVRLYSDRIEVDGYGRQLSYRLALPAAGAPG
jgi:manganese-dependent ADP-ribose/CDP-alcohol diphosphatase